MVDALVSFIILFSILYMVGYQQNMEFYLSPAEILF